MQLPVIRQISWAATIPQVVSLIALVIVGCYVFGVTNGPLVGVGAYVIYSFGSRMLIARDHKRGLTLLKAGRFKEAISAFEASYAFLSQHLWIDRFRWFVMMTPAAMSYREMALCNIAFTYSQLGDGANAEAYYRRTLNEFPENGIAQAALKMIESSRAGSGSQASEKTREL